MKRLILTSPTGLTLDQLTPEQQAGIQSVFAQYILPMPGTISYNDLSILDSVTTDNFTVESITTLGLPFTVMGMWQWEGNAESPLIELEPLDPSFINYLPEGSILHIPNNWAGWPEVIL
jgi:hypothetical protein